MDIKYLRYNEIDFDCWDACVYRAVNSLPYAYSWYLDIVTDGQWDALVYGNYEVVMPLPYRKKWLVKYVYQPHWIQQLGVFSVYPLNEKMVLDFLQSIPQQFKYLDFYLNEANSFALKEVPATPRINYVVSLNKSYDVLHKGYNNNTKRNVKKAMAYKQQVQHNIPPNAIVRLHQNTVGKKNNNFDKKYYANIERLMYICLHKRMATALGVYDAHNELSAVAFFMQDQKRIIHLLSASNDAGKKAGSMFTIFDYLIQKNAATNTLLDFEGSMLAGVAQFYHGFGGKEVNYWHVKANRLPFLLRYFKK